jgi:hypothetical protein
LKSSVTIRSAVSNTFAFQQEKPDGVDIEDGVFAEMKRVQLITGSDSPGLGSPV